MHVLTTIFVPCTCAYVCACENDDDEALQNGNEDPGGETDTDIDGAPTTLPREFWHKKVTDYTDEERARLKQWLADTRQWRISTKQAMEARNEAEAAAREEEELIARQNLVDEHVAAKEKELNAYGLSLERSREIALKGFDLFPLPYSEPETNETLLRIRADPELMKKELSGGLDPEGCPEWVEAMEWLDGWVENRMDMTLEEAVRQHEEDEIKGAELDAQLAQESEDSLLDYDQQDSGAVSREDEEGELVLDEDAGPEGRPGRRRKLGDVVTWGWEKGESLPLGLENLGNTCYMAAALQALRAVPELVRGVLTSSGPSSGLEPDLQDNLVHAIRLLYLELTDRKESVKPYTAIHHLRQLVPQFAESGPMGPMQQDAEECLAAIMQALDAKLAREDAAATAQQGAQQGGDGLGVSGGRVRQLFEIELETNTKCAEDGAEDAVVVQVRLQIAFHVRPSALRWWSLLAFGMLLPLARAPGRSAMLCCGRGLGDCLNGGACRGVRPQGRRARQLLRESLEAIGRKLFHAREICWEQAPR